MRNVYTLEPTAGAASHPHARRLRELERLGLATPEAPDRWKVSPNLVQELPERQHGAPFRHRLLVRKEPLSLQDQVRYPGPVWLDRIETGSFARYGFGVEVKRAVERWIRPIIRGAGARTPDPRSLRNRVLHLRYCWACHRYGRAAA